MQRDLFLPVRQDGDETEVAHGHQHWPWMDDIAISVSPQQPREPTGPTAPTQQQPQIAIGNTKISLDHLLALRDAAERLKETYDKLLPAREQAMLQRSGSVYEREQYFHRRRFFRESQDEYMRHFRNQEGLPVLESWRAQVEADHVALSTQDTRLRAIEGELSDTEFYMKPKEEALAKATEDLLRALGVLGISSHGRAASGRESHSARSLASSLRPTSSENDPLLEDYREKVGAISWQKERALDIRREWDKARGMRIFKQDHEQDVEEDDEAFEAKHRQMVTDAEATVQAAVKDADEARKACLEAGLDPDAGRDLPADGLIYLASAPVTPDRQSTPPAAGLSIVPDVLSGGGKSSTFLSTLTGNLHAEPTLPSPHTEDSDLNDNRVEEWMNTSISEEFPFDDRRFEEYPISRPTLYARISEPDLRRLSVDPKMIQTMPQQFQERLDPRNVPQAGEWSQRQRSSSESRLPFMEKRQDSGHGSISDIIEQQRKK